MHMSGRKTSFTSRIREGVLSKKGRKSLRKKKQLKDNESKSKGSDK